MALEIKPVLVPEDTEIVPTGRFIETSALITLYAIRDHGVEAIRMTKRQLRFDLEDKIKALGLTADGPIAFRTYAQSGFSPTDLLYKEEPWIPVTPLPEWALLVRVDAEVYAV